MTRLRVIEERPRTRGDCKRGPRPCPWIACRHHLADVRVDVDGDLYVRGVRLPLAASADEVAAFVDRMVDTVTALPKSCALDVVDRTPDGATLQEVGEALDLTRERVRQIETIAKRHGAVRVANRGLR